MPFKGQQVKGQGREVNFPVNALRTLMKRYTNLSPPPPVDMSYDDCLEDKT